MRSVPLGPSAPRPLGPPAPSRKGRNTSLTARPRGFILLLAGLLLVLAGLSARMLLGARAEVATARAATARGDVEAQIRHLRRAMAYYLPGNPWVREAHDRLLHLARTADRRGQPGLALHVWHELRGAILMLRGSTRPFSDTLPEANRRIAALTAAATRGARPGALPGLERLASPPEPHPGWAALALAGFAAWVGGSLLLLLLGLRPDATVVARRFWPLAGLVGLGLVLFGVGLAWA